MNYVFFFFFFFSNSSSGPVGEHAIHTFLQPLARPRPWYTRWDLGRVVWSSSNISQKNTHVLPFLSLREETFKRGRKETEGATETPQPRLLANYFYMTSDDFGPGVSRFVPSPAFMSVINRRGSRSQTVLSTGGLCFEPTAGRNDWHSLRIIDQWE